MQPRKLNGALQEGRKFCRSCGLEKPVTDFGIVLSNHDGRRYSCKTCYNEVRKEYRRHNSDKVRAAKIKHYYARHEHNKKLQRDKGHEKFVWKLKKFYGMTVDDYMDILDRQGGRCAVCDRKPMPENGHKIKKRLHVDHCHRTGVVRGLLCNSCNIALGCLGDNVKILLAAAEYLQKYEMPCNQDD